MIAIVSDAVWIALLGGIPATLMAAATFVQAWKMHKAVNSKMDSFLRLTAKSSRAAGVREGESRKTQR